MEVYHLKRVVTWIARQLQKGASWEGVLAANAKRKPPFADKHLLAARPHAEQANANRLALIAELQRLEMVDTAALAGGAPPPVHPPIRLCDLKGCKFPGK